MIATAKAKEESKEVYRKSRVNNSDKWPFRKSSSVQKQNGGKFISFTTPRYGRGENTKQGDKEMIAISKEIWKFLLSKEIMITAEYLSGRLNVSANWASRNF